MNTCFRSFITAALGSIASAGLVAGMAAGLALSLASGPIAVAAEGNTTTSTGSTETEPPHVRNQPLTITATIESDRPQGTVVAQGGLRFGYSLHFVDGRPAFSVRKSGTLTELIAGEPVSGQVTIRAVLNRDRMSIDVNDQRVVERKSPGPLTAQPAIGLSIGEDAGDPVGKYAAPNRFDGRLVAHQIQVGPPKVAMRTPWGEQLEKSPAEQPWNEYPRPAFRRDQWTNLNGMWDYAVTPKDVTSAPQKWDGKIRVPFAVESPLSGVERRVWPDDALWYRRSLSIEKSDDRRYRINFEAVDYQSTLWVNGQEVGSNTGGNLPFSFDITDALRSGENELTLRVTDATDTEYQLHGKQVLNPRAIWYTPVSGIWQTVWLEELPPTYLTDVKIVATNDGAVKLKIAGNHASAAPATAVRVLLDGQEIVSGNSDSGELTLQVPDPRLWSPDSPALYDLELRAGDDVVQSYFGFRETAIQPDADGHPRFTLNGKPIFHWGTLDQGWWPDGLLTPPSDAAMVSDIQFLKAAGFNTLRKHIKVEPRRYYYHCDKLGMMVWQDQVSSGTGTQTEGKPSSPPWTRLQPNPVDAEWPDEAHQQFMFELKKMIDTLHNHPCIVQWVPFNEAWGQHRTEEVGKWTVQYDPTRQVNIASGGNFFPVGHIVDHHEYPHPKFPFDLGANGRFDGFVKIVGEFGGHGYPVQGHLWDPNARNWGYGNLPKSKEEWLERYRESIRRLAELRKQGIAAGIYTQTTDVEGEINGLLTYDRRVKKITPEQLLEIHRENQIVQSPVAADSQ